MSFFPYALPHIVVKSARNCRNRDRWAFEDRGEFNHRLLAMNTSGHYTKNELRYSDVRSRIFTQDAIITLREDDYEDVMAVKSELYCKGDDVPVTILDSCLQFDESTMVVLDTFTKKLHYAIAGALSSDNRAQYIRQINCALMKLFPNVQIEVDEDADGGDDNILFGYIADRRLTLSEFLLNKKYIVVVDYVEFNNMRRIGLIDEFEIADVYTRRNTLHDGICITNGVWSIQEKDLCFKPNDFKVLSTVEGKVRYAIATHTSYDVDEICNIMKEAYPEIREILLPYVKDGDGERSVGWSCNNAIPKDIPLRDFILDKRYVVVADGTYGGTWVDFQYSKLFNSDAIA